MIVRNGIPILTGDGKSYWTLDNGVKRFMEVEVQGKDFFVDKAPSTFWGGPKDPEDAGLAASGINTARHPSLMAVSLPVDVGSLLPSTQGSPIQALRHSDGSFAWGAKEVNGQIVYLHDGVWVAVYSPINHRRFIVPWIDLGPAKEPHAHGWLDCTGALYEALGKPDYVPFRILNALDFSPNSLIQAVKASKG